ncbi:MAG: phosphoribosylaminoimidazolesuccinocarboxamide synthase [Bacillota bacterium]|nr:phosphoribosylaminoimidazolesuccinocarboxamide synthase [Bacillota bacterium]
MDRLYEGKAKIVYLTGEPEVLLVHFKDDATAFDGAKRGTIGGKGYCNAHISAHAFCYLERAGVPTHFRELRPPTDMLCTRVRILPVEVVMRNIAAGSISKRLGIEEGTDLPFPVLEHFYKNDDLHDPLINTDHIRALGLASEEQMDAVNAMARKINGLLRGFFAQCGLLLVDFKLEFGVTSDGRILLADEISPDTCRLWDAETRAKLDKDRFRRDMGGVEEAYQEVLRRVEKAAG